MDELLLDVAAFAAVAAGEMVAELVSDVAVEVDEGLVAATGFSTCVYEEFDDIEPMSMICLLLHSAMNGLDTVIGRDMSLFTTGAIKSCLNPVIWHACRNEHPCFPVAVHIEPT